MNADTDWADLELLDTIARSGTLSRAAQFLGVDQTTVSRRLAALERRIGTPLFDRIDGRLVATPPLASIADRLRTISQEAALSMSSLKQATAQLNDHVRITSVGFVLSSILAPALGPFATNHPGIRLDLLGDDQSLSFERRETDLAIRLGRTAENSTLIRSIGNLRFRLCRPTGKQHDAPAGVVRYGASLSHVAEMQALDRARPDARTLLTATQFQTLIEASLALDAEVMLPEVHALKDPRFEIVEKAGAQADRPMFLMLHPERARVPAVTITAEWIVETMRLWLKSV